MVVTRKYVKENLIRGATIYYFLILRDGKMRDKVIASMLLGKKYDETK